jgi:hypothetical protein
MIFRCTQCQRETPAPRPPQPVIAPPCPHCGGSLTLITDTEPPPRRGCNHKKNGVHCTLDHNHQGQHNFGETSK